MDARGSRSRVAARALRVWVLQPFAHADWNDVHGRCFDSALATRDESLRASKKAYRAMLNGVVLDRALTAATGMNLGLHNGDRGTQLLKCLGGLLGRTRDEVERRRDAGIAQQLFSLIFVNLHAATPVPGND